MVSSFVLHLIMDQRHEEIEVTQKVSQLLGATRQSFGCQFTQ